jgi:hypothetical protein
VKTVGKKCHTAEFGVEVMKIPVIQMTTGRHAANEHLEYSDCRPLPPSYMSEYSVMGLVVDRLDDTIRILGRNGLVINREAFGAEVGIDDPSWFPVMFGMLAEAGICFSVGDVIDSLYQG